MPGTWLATSIDAWLTFTGTATPRAEQARGHRQAPSWSVPIGMPDDMGMMANFGRGFAS